MQLSKLPKTTSKSKKRVGRGYGSGRGGHTSTRGSKGQKARGNIGLFFEGTKFKKSLIKRLPLFRGKGKLKVKKAPILVINLKYLNLFKSGEEVSLESLQKKGILTKKLKDDVRVKILGDGEIQASLTVTLPVSGGARKKIEKAGGKVVEKGREKAPVVEKNKQENGETQKEKKEKTNKSPVKNKKESTSG